LSNPNYIKHLFFKFLSDECTPQEVEEILDYLKYSTDRGRALPGVEEVKAKLKELPKMEEQRADQVFAAIIKSSPNKEKNSKTPGKTITRTWVQNWKVAATLSGLLLLSAILLLYLKQEETIRYATEFGETKTIVLHDGSKVVLNANSSLTLPSQWNGTGAREVWLEGEAFFSVSHKQDNRKFLVHTTHQLSVEVLGTEFNVNSRENKATVVLNSGKVQVNVPPTEKIEQWIMQPGDLLEYNLEQKQIQQKAVDTTLYTSWRNNLLVFKDTPLIELAQLIEANYGYQLSFESDSLANLEFTGSNPADKLELLLMTIEKSFNLKIKQDGKQIMLKSKP